MSYRLPVLVSDIQANKQIPLPEDNYFVTGNEESLISALKRDLRQNFESVKYDMSMFNWDNIARQTAKVYDKILKVRK